MVAHGIRMLRAAAVLVAAGLSATTLTACHRDYIIGDFVWLDTDRDGIQDPGEPGIQGIKVRACSYSSSRDFYCRTTVTAADGGYRIGNTVNAVFDTYVEITIEAPTGYLFTPSNQGADDALDSEGRSITLGPYRHNDLPPDDLSIDVGLIRPEITTGDLVWDDLDRDGIQDPGEPGIAGVPVALLAEDGSVLASTVSGSGGTYALGPIQAGVYRVRFGPLPAGRQFTEPHRGGNDFLDSDADRVTGETPAIAFADGHYASIDAGLVAEGPVPVLGEIGDFVWRDFDLDGIQDPGEPGVAGVGVNLQDGAFVIEESITDANGRYRFTNLAAGQYRVRFLSYDGSRFTGRDAGGDDTVDSDAAADGLTGIITLASGQINNTVDAGLGRPS